MPSNATALKLEKLGLKYKYDDGHAVSLENFDQHDTSKVIILTSPRSIDACLKTGISAYELLKRYDMFILIVILKRPMSYFTEQGISPEIVEKRAHIYEQKRVEKLKLVREERKKTMDLENSALNYSSVSTEDMEFQRLEKQMRSAKVHMELSIAHEIEMKRKAYETQVRLRQRYEKEQLEKEEKQRQAKEREAQRIKNAVEFKLRTKMLLDMQQQQLLEKRMKMEEKEREHQTYIEETKKKMMEENSMRRSTSNSKVEQTRQESQKIQMKHQMDAIRKQDEFEKRKQEFEEAKQQMKTVLMQKAKTKEEKLNITIERNKMIEKKKQMRAIQKQKDFEEKQRQQQLEHEKETQQRKLLEALKDQKRMEKVEKVKHDDEKRVESIVHQQLEQDEVLQQHLQQLQKEHMLRLEENNLKEQDRKDAVERRKRIAEFKKLQTLAKIEQKNAKADQLADLRASMIEKKIKQREILKRSKQILCTVTIASNT